MPPSASCRPFPRSNLETPGPGARKCPSPARGWVAVRSPSSPPSSSVRLKVGRAGLFGRTAGRAGYPSWRSPAPASYAWEIYVGCAGSLAFCTLHYSSKGKIITLTAEGKNPTPAILVKKKKKKQKNNKKRSEIPSNKNIVPCACV